MAKLVINNDKKMSTIAPEIYGHFSEHLGRCIYEGLYVGEDSDNTLNFFFSTYQSIEVVSAFQKKSGINFNIIICDEAHRTTGVTLAGEDESNFVKVHSNDFIKADKRLYMTATPRIYGDESKKKATEGSALLCSSRRPSGLRKTNW